MYFDIDLSSQKSLLRNIEISSYQDVVEFGARFDGISALNNRSTHAITYLNSAGFQLTETSPKDFYKDTIKVMLETIHPTNLAFNKKIITKWDLVGDETSVLQYFQYLKSKKTGQYDWFLSLKKQISDKENFTVTTPLHQIHNMEKMIRPFAPSYSFSKTDRLFWLLTVREKQILRMLSNDITWSQISEILEMPREQIRLANRLLQSKLSARSDRELVKVGRSFFKS